MDPPEADLRQDGWDFCGLMDSCPPEVDARLFAGMERRRGNDRFCYEVS